MFPPEVWDASHSGSNREPGGEADVVHQLDNVAGGEVGQAEAGDDDDAGDWSRPGDGDHGESSRHLTLSGPGKEQSGGGEELPIDGSECAAGNKDRNDPGHPPVQSVSEGHRHRL